jgi:hypothetical protein
LFLAELQVRKGFRKVAVHRAVPQADMKTDNLADCANILIARNSLLLELNFFGD